MRPRSGETEVRAASAARHRGWSPVVFIRQGAAGHAAADRRARSSGSAVPAVESRRMAPPSVPYAEARRRPCGYGSGRHARSNSVSVPGLTRRVVTRTKHSSIAASSATPPLLDCLTAPFAPWVHGGVLTSSAVSGRGAADRPGPGTGHADRRRRPPRSALSSADRYAGHLDYRPLAAVPAASECPRGRSTDRPGKHGPSVTQVTKKSMEGM